MTSHRLRGSGERGVLTGASWQQIDGQPEPKEAEHRVANVQINGVGVLQVDAKNIKKAHSEDHHEHSKHANSDAIGAHLQPCLRRLVDKVRRDQR